MLNLVGGAVLVAVLTVEGALPSGSPEALVGVAQDVVDKDWPATLARAVLAGALITLLSYMLNAVNSITARILGNLAGLVMLALVLTRAGLVPPETLSLFRTSLRRSPHATQSRRC